MRLDQVIKVKLVTNIQIHVENETKSPSYLKSSSTYIVLSEVFYDIDN